MGDGSTEKRIQRTLSFTLVGYRGLHEDLDSRKRAEGRSREEVMGVKVLRAHGECLGACGRRRTWQAAISCGEVQATLDPQISEWGNPAGC